MDDLSYYDDVGVLQSVTDSGLSDAPTVMPEPYAAPDTPYVVAPATDSVYLDAPVVSVEAPVAITDVTIAYDPSPAIFLVDTPVVAVSDPVYVEPVFADPVYVQPVYINPVYVEPLYIEPVYIEPAVLVLPSFNPYSYVLDGTQGSVSGAVLDFHPGDDLTVLGYQDGLDGWSFLGAGDPAGSPSGPTVVGSLDGASASFAVTLAGISAFDGLGVSSGVTPDGVGYLHFQS